MGVNFTLQKILMILLHRLHLIIIAGVVFGVITFAYSTMFITPMYSTSTMIFIQNYGKTTQNQTAATQPQNPAQTQTQTPAQSQSGGNSDAVQSNNRIAEKIFSSDISGSSSLAKICVILFNNSDELAAIYDGCSVSYDVVDGTFYINVNVSGSDPQKCANVANQIAEKARDVFTKNFSYGQIGTIRTAKEPSAPYAPNVMQNTLIGAAAGIVLACVISILLELIDTTVKPDDDLSSIYKVPVFAEIPDFES